ncbi:hypothetical protein V5E97_37905 [Singulisphaera sp. Ch08]|uniref:Uncharacterized protein n=1 Tax=Singulisphaera sp. Ch08 TaxID=3120278 RepID=A0AAU7CFJ8_9BACT
MPILTHLTSEKHAGSIRRSGIRASTVGFDAPRGVFCMAILPDYLIAHEWLRELKRRGQRTIVGVDFRIPSDEPVSVGHFNRSHDETTLGQAIGMLMGTTDAVGFEIIVPRSIRRDEIFRVRKVRQVLGWRHFPDAHGKRPTCACRMCLPKGTIKSRRLRNHLDPTGENY